MGLPIPAVCQTPQCGVVWLATGIVSATTPVNVVRCFASPCPKCGGRGRIPDGRYSPSGGLLFNQADLNIIIAALQKLAQQASQGDSASKLSREISAKYPALEPLKPFLPKNASDLSGYLIALLTSATLLSQCSGNKPQPVNVLVREEIAITLAQAPADQKTSPQKSQATQPDKESKQTEEN